jgi:hypothetical protein
VYGTCGAVAHACHGAKPAGDETRCLEAVSVVAWPPGPYISGACLPHFCECWATSLALPDRAMHLSLVLVVCSDCCCHIVQAEDSCITVVVGVPPVAGGCPRLPQRGPLRGARLSGCGQLALGW